MAKLKKIKCSFCINEIEWDLSDEISKAIIYDGACNWFTCGYGSKFDGEQLLLVICDICLAKADILKKKNYLFKKKD